MNIEDARKVFWVRTNPRPLGELLAEGFLSKKDLEWASQSAYNPNLKLAAKIILESMNNAMPTNQVELPPKIEEKEKETITEIRISLDKARATLWPFKPYRGQLMGTLIDSRQLSLRDLVFAVENAWDDKVKQAAIAFSLVRLKQAIKEPVSSAGFVHVVSGGRSFAQRRETFFTLLQGIIIGLFIALMFFFMSVSFRGTEKPNPNAKTLAEVISTPGGLFGVIFVLGAAVLIGLLINFALDRITKRLDKQIEEHRFGQEGEDNVAQLIVQALDGNWHLFRNIVIPGRNKADLDFVLVGPPGIWALEVKNYHGEYRNIGETWELRNGKNWKSAKRNPSRQANNNSLRLKNFLQADKVNVFVNAAVIWANSEGVLTVENPTVTVWRSSRLADELGNIWQGEKISEAERNKIVEKLTKLCEQQKNKK